MDSFQSLIFVSDKQTPNVDEAKYSEKPTKSTSYETSNEWIKECF